MGLAGSNVTLTTFALNGTSTGTESDAYTCDPTTSLVTFTDSKGKKRFVATSPTGLFIDEAGTGTAGLSQATSNITLTPGDTYLGMLYEPNATPTTTTVGFTVGRADRRSSVLPLRPPASPQNLPVARWYRADTDSEFTAVADTVLFGITFDTITNTPVTVLLSQQ